MKKVRCEECGKEYLRAESDALRSCTETIEKVRCGGQVQPEAEFVRQEDVLEIMEIVREKFSHYWSLNENEETLLQDYNEHLEKAISFNMIAGFEDQFREVIESMVERVKRS